ncbi:MAG TPA: tetratricopeptide repeat protein [Kofleriaceae bacterium]
MAPAVAAEVAKLRDRLAQARTLEQLGRYDESLAVARDASTATERLGYSPVHAEALVQVARALGERSTADTRKEAQKLYFDALTLAEAERHDQLTVEIWTQLVRLAARMDSNMAQAHEWWGQAYAWSRRNAPMLRLPGDDVDNQAELHYLLGQIYFRESEYGKAADEERRAIAAISVGSAHSLELSHYNAELANALERMGDVGKAIQLYERALAIATGALGATHPRVLMLRINYGIALKIAGRHDEARVVLQDALASMVPQYRDAHLDAARIHSLLSELDYGQGHLDRAAGHARMSLQIYERALSPEHVRTAEAYTNLANVEFMRRNYTEALTLYEHALMLRRRHFGGDHYQVGVAEVSVAETLFMLEHHDDAMVHVHEAERIFTRGSAREPEIQAWLFTVQGEILVAQQKFSAAVPVLERALGQFSDYVADQANHALAMWALARALREVGGDRNRVRSLAERAHTIFAGLGPTEAQERDAVAHFLAGLLQQGPEKRSDAGLGIK